MSSSFYGFVQMRPAAPVSNYVCFWIRKTEKGYSSGGGWSTEGGLMCLKKSPRGGSHWICFWWELERWSMSGIEHSLPKKAQNQQQTNSGLILHEKLEILSFFDIFSPILLRFNWEFWVTVLVVIIFSLSNTQYICNKVSALETCSDK